MILIVMDARTVVVAAATALLVNLAVVFWVYAAVAS